TLRLVKDLPVTGRVVDLQGRPLRGVTVRVLTIEVPTGPDLAPLLAAARAGRGGGHDLERAHLTRGLKGGGVPDRPRQAVTEADGRFRLGGIGAERVVAVRFEGPAVASQEASILTRRVPALQVPVSPGDRNLGSLTWYGADFTHAAAPTKPVVGVV